MGRRKIAIEKIEDVKMRAVTYRKRKNGLLKKAMELSLLCGVDVALVVLPSEDLPNVMPSLYVSKEDVWMDLRNSAKTAPDVSARGAKTSQQQMQILQNQQNQQNHAREQANKLREQQQQQQSQGNASSSGSAPAAAASATNTRNVSPARDAKNSQTRSTRNSAK